MVCLTAKGYNKLFLAAGNNLGTAGVDELGEEFIDAKKSKSDGCIQKKSEIKNYIKIFN